MIDPAIFKICPNCYGTSRSCGFCHKARKGVSMTINSYLGGSQGTAAEKAPDTRRKLHITIVPLTDACREEGYNPQVMANLAEDCGLQLYNSGSRFWLTSDDAARLVKLARIGRALATVASVDNETIDHVLALLVKDGKL